jgi:hypothetical protein
MLHIDFERDMIILKIPDRGQIHLSNPFLNTLTVLDFVCPVK